MSLPPAIERYLARALPHGADVPGAMSITQEGTMWMKPGGAGHAFTATEHFEVRRVAFTWRARFRVAGPLAFRVIDAYDAGRGLLEARLFGLRLARQQGPSLAIGEALRYLAELPWVPYAMRANGELQWRELEDGRIEVSADAGEGRAAATFELDGGGDIVRVSALRPRGGEAGLSPWGGEFGEYVEFDGVRMPAAAEVYWEVDGDRFVYWKGRVLSASPR